MTALFPNAQVLEVWSMYIRAVIERSLSLLSQSSPNLYEVPRHGTGMADFAPYARDRQMISNGLLWSRSIQSRTRILVCAHNPVSRSRSRV